MDADELDQFQQLSDSYEPELSGPLVGPRASTELLSKYFKGGDPIYEKKFNALCKSHPTCRSIKGDGNCGWRAISFAYFELLLRLGDVERVDAEKERFKSLCSILDQTGRQPHLYELFFDAVEDAFDKVKQAIVGGNTKDDSVIEEPFNNQYNSDCIVTHFRLLTGSWLMTHPDVYEAFLPIPLREYVNQTVDTVKTEIDEIGLQALLDGVIKGSGFGVDILYLDRSEGQEATRHRNLEPKEGNLTITLLYRPGHYDILYQGGQTEQAPRN
ncbi:hypothetical protein KEM56_001188 [Ascosphaera pollenicola]|nr:hypothetical protein KEM56_001188 [Ascosphaera pollenicola]